MGQRLRRPSSSSRSVFEGESDVRVDTKRKILLISQFMNLTKRLLISLVKSPVKGHCALGCLQHKSLIGQLNENPSVKYLTLMTATHAFFYNLTIV